MVKIEKLPVCLKLLPSNSQNHPLFVIRQKKKHPPTHVAILNSQRAISISSLSVEKMIRYLLQACRVHGNEIAVHFVGKKKISGLHSIFFNDSSVTDCITFPVTSSLGYKHLGEIFVCPQVALAYAKKHHCDLYEELTLYTLHGFLHLLGYKDTTALQQKQMRRYEKKYMLALAKNNLRITP